MLDGPSPPSPGLHEQWLGDLHVLDLAPLLRLCSPAPALLPAAAASPSTLLNDLGRLLVGSGIEQLDALAAASSAPGGPGTARVVGAKTPGGSLDRPVHLLQSASAVASLPPGFDTGGFAAASAASLVQLPWGGAGASAEVDVLTLVSHWPAHANPHNGEADALLAPAGARGGGAAAAAPQTAQDSAGGSLEGAREAFESEVSASAAHPLADYAPFLAALWEGSEGSQAEPGRAAAGISPAGRWPGSGGLLSQQQRHRSVISPMLIPPPPRARAAPLALPAPSDAATAATAADHHHLIPQPGAWPNEAAARWPAGVPETAPRGGDASASQDLPSAAGALQPRAPGPEAGGAAASRLSAAAGGEPSFGAAHEEPMLSPDELPASAAAVFGHSLVSSGGGGDPSPHHPRSAAGGAGVDPLTGRPLFAQRQRQQLPAAPQQQAGPSAASDPQPQQLRRAADQRSHGNAALAQMATPEGVEETVGGHQGGRNAAPAPATSVIRGGISGRGTLFYTPDASPSFADVTFVACGVPLRLHRALLSARSEFFARLLAGGFAEASGGSGGAIDLGSDLHPGAVAALLRFIYTDQLSVALPAAPGGPGPDVPLLLALLELAQQWGVGRASLLAQTALARLMRAENAAGLLEVADRLQASGSAVSTSEREGSSNPRLLFFSAPSQALPLRSAAAGFVLRHYDRVSLTPCYAELRSDLQVRGAMRGKRRLWRHLPLSPPLLRLPSCAPAAGPPLPPPAP